MPRYKLSHEERAAEKERKENLRNNMKRLYISQSESIWTDRRKSSECGLAKMKAQSFGSVCQFQSFFPIPLKKWAV